MFPASLPPAVRRPEIAARATEGVDVVRPATAPRVGASFGLAQRQSRTDAASGAAAVPTQKPTSQRTAQRARGRTAGPGGWHCMCGAGQPKSRNFPLFSFSRCLASLFAGSRGRSSDPKRAGRWPVCPPNRAARRPLDRGWLSGTRHAAGRWPIGMLKRQSRRMGALASAGGPQLISSPFASRCCGSTPYMYSRHCISRAPDLQKTPASEAASTPLLDVALVPEEAKPVAFFPRRRRLAGD